MLTNENAKLRKFKGEKKKNGVKVSLLRTNRHFLEAVLYIRDSNLFGTTGAPRMIPPKIFHKREPADTYPEMNEYEFHGLGDNVSSNPQSCFLISIGVERFKEYTQTFHVDGDPNDPRRPEVGDDSVNLSTIAPGLSQTEGTYQQDKARCVSEDIDYLMKRGVYSKKPLDEEMAYTKSLLMDAEWDAIMQQHPNPAEGGGARKRLKLTRLVAARVALRRRNPEWAQNRLDSLKCRYQAALDRERQDVKQKIETELNTVPHYLTASPTVRDSYRTRLHKLKLVGSAPPASPARSTGEDEESTALYSMRSSQSTKFGLSTLLFSQDPSKWKK